MIQYVKYGYTIVLYMAFTVALVIIPVIFDILIATWSI